MTTATTTTRAEAQRLISAAAEAEEALRQWDAPDLGIHQVGESTRLFCPWCHSDLPPDGGVIAIDADTRRNVGSYEMPTHEPQINFTDGDSDYTTVYYTTACCALPVAIPQTWEVFWH